MVSSPLRQRHGDTASSPSTFRKNEYVGLSSGLLKYIQRSRAELEDWVADETARMDKAWDDYQGRVEKEQAELDAQVANLLAVQLERGCTIVEENNDDVDANGSSRSSMAKKSRELQEQAKGLQAEIVKLQDKQQHRLQQLQDVVSDKELKRIKTEAILAEKNEKEAAKQARLGKFHNIILQYQQHLGFHYEKAENLSLRLWFTLLDAKDPSRKFSFRMSVDDQDMFVVEDCQPFIQPDTLAQLLQQVNDTDRGQEDFSKLILSMRKAFAAII